MSELKKLATNTILWDDTKYPDLLFQNSVRLAKTVLVMHEALETFCSGYSDCNAHKFLAEVEKIARGE